MSRISTTSSRGASALYKRQSSADFGNKESLTSDTEDEGQGGDSLVAAVNTVSNYVQNISREVHLYVDNTSGKQRVSIVDSSTGQTIRHVPVNELMDLSRHIANRNTDPIKGLLVKSKA